jgi:WD40 repeat protein
LLPDAPPQSIASGLGTIFWVVSAASSDGKVLVVADKTVAILIHRDRAGPPLILGPQPGMGVGGAVISPDGKWIVTSGAGSDGVSKTVRIWDGNDGRHAQDLPMTRPSWCKFSPDGRWLAVNSSDESQVWKVGTWDKPVRTLSGDFMFSPDGEIMAVMDVVGSIRLVKTESGQEVARLTGPEQGSYEPLCFTPDGTRLIAGLGWMYVWDLRLIRQELKAMGLDWDLPPFPAQVPDTPGRLKVTIDTGIPAQDTPGATSSRPREPAADRRPLIK